MDLRISAQHWAKPHVCTQVPEDLNDRQLVEPYVVIHQCPFPYLRPFVSMPHGVRVDTRTQLLQLHMHGRHVCLSHRGLNLVSPL